MAQLYMPAKGERSAPTFDQDKPRELSRFFSELERLFQRVGVTVERDKKDELLRYVDFDVEQIWRTFPEYANGASTFKDFKDKILSHYPDSKGDYVYALRDMDSLIGDYQRSGIHTTDDLQKFHLQFLAITTWLIQKNQMGDFEQRAGYLRAFQPPLLASITNRLQMLFLNQHPGVLHTIQEVHDAARYVLHSTNTRPQHHYALATAPIVTTVAQPIASSSGSIKIETFASVMAEFSKTITNALQGQNRTWGPSQPTDRHVDCNFCGGPHFIRDCTVVNEYIVAGKVKRNIEGRVVLSTGSFVPSTIPGTLLMERVDEWHRRFPNQLAAASLIHTISAEHIKKHSTAPASLPSFQLSATDRIATLESELFTLRARRSAFTPIVKTRAQHARELPLAASIEEVDEDDSPLVRAPAEAALAKKPQAPLIAPGPVVVITAPPIVEKEHPFRNASDAAYAPPTDRNVGAQAKVPFSKTDAPAYKTLPPIYDASIAGEVYKRSMETPITITQRELLSLSPEVRSQVRDVTTYKRIPTPAAAPLQGNLYVANSPEDIAYDIAPTFALETIDERIPPKGATVIPDPIEAYYNSLAPGESPSLDRLTVAKESTAIRSIHALVYTRLSRHVSEKRMHSRPGLSDHSDVRDHLSQPCASIRPPHSPQHGIREWLV
jgi:hypothetical protein